MTGIAKQLSGLGAAKAALYFYTGQYVLKTREKETGGERISYLSPADVRAAFTAERLHIRLELASGEVLHFIYTTDSRNSETRYYPISQLPGDIGTKLRDEVKRLGG